MGFLSSSHLDVLFCSDGLFLCAKRFSRCHPTSADRLVRCVPDQRWIMCFLFWPYRCRDVAGGLGNKLHYCFTRVGRRMSDSVRVAAVTLEISLDAAQYLAISTVPPSPLYILPRIYCLCRSLGLQLYSGMATRVWS